MSFEEFVTDEKIIALLCREKCKRIRRARRKEPQNLDEELKLIMPSRREWLRINRSKRFMRDSASSSKQHIPSSVLQLKTLNYTIRKHRKSNPEKPYITRLNSYIDHIKGICSGAIDFTFSKPAVIPKLKDENDQEMIYRPISKYDTLDDKIMLNLTNQYLSVIFNDFLHDEILSYRIRRNYKGEIKITNQHDAIRSIKEYLEHNKRENIYVAECDIRKFFDILNHKIIKREFTKLLSKTSGHETGVITKFFNSYIDSYSYYSDVSVKNSDPSYWNRYRVSMRKMCKTRKFDWIDQERVVEDGIYTGEEWNNERDQIGTPQGGALSLLVSNIVMNSVDQVIVEKNDPERLFIRYGDDIILMHTRRQKCEELINEYKRSLGSYKLLHHPFKPVSEFKDQEKTLKGYWDNKSKSVFRWGKGTGDAAQWIGFVGYELSRDGDVRIRRSTLSSQFSKINRTYHHVRRLRDPEQKSVGRFGELVAERLNFNNYPTIKTKLFSDTFRELTVNRYSVTQIKALDRYRNKKFRRLRQQFKKAGFNRNFYLGKPFSYYYHFNRVSQGKYPESKEYED